MRVTLLRHAHTLGNLRAAYIGSTDEPLAPEGIATARRAATGEAVRVVHTSALERTRQTAAILYPGADIVAHAGFNEMNFGIFEGKNWQDLAHDPRYAAWLDSHCEEPCPEGESKQMVARRCHETFMNILHDAHETSMNSVHCVVHGGTIMALMSGFVVPEQDWFAWKAPCCGGYVIERLPGTDRFRVLETVVPSTAHETARGGGI